MSSPAGLAFCSSPVYPSRRVDRPVPLPQLELAPTAGQDSRRDPGMQAGEDPCSDAGEDGVLRENSGFTTPFFQHETGCAAWRREGASGQAQRHTCDVERGLLLESAPSVEGTRAACPSSDEKDADSARFDVSAVRGAPKSTRIADEPGPGGLQTEVRAEVSGVSCSGGRSLNTTGEDGAGFCDLEVDMVGKTNTIVQGKPTVFEERRSTSAPGAAGGKTAGTSVAAGEPPTGFPKSEASGSAEMRVNGHVPGGRAEASAGRGEATLVNEPRRQRKRSGEAEEEVEGLRRSDEETTVGRDGESSASVRKKKRKTRTVLTPQQPAQAKLRRKHVVFDPGEAWPAFVDLSMKRFGRSGTAEVCYSVLFLPLERVPQFLPQAQGPGGAYLHSGSKHGKLLPARCRLCSSVRVYTQWVDWGGVVSLEADATPACNAFSV